MRPHSRKKIIWLSAAVTQVTERNLQSNQVLTKLQRMPDATTAKIAALNDHARQTFGECRVVITQGVAELGKVDVAYILDKVRKYKDFTPINDPYFEHDFGSIQFGENTIFWKIDYYDIDLQMHSPDPSDPAVTTRILTIMLAEEY